jgi:hypothetical protein
MGFGGIPVGKMPTDDSALPLHTNDDMCRCKATLEFSPTTLTLPLIERLVKAFTTQ